MRRFATALFSLILVGVFVIAVPSLASAHDVLQKTTPSDGATLATMPSTISLQFAEPPLAIGTQVIVKGPSGNVTAGQPTIEGNTVVQAISTFAPEGGYTVTYRVTSDDGHPIAGTFSFQAAARQDGGSGATTAPMSVTPETTLTAGAVASTGTAVAAETSSFVPVLLGIVGVIAVVAIGAFFLVRRRQQA